MKKMSALIGLPFINEIQWRRCCITHDISYWQGGTELQRKLADEKLGQCVAETGPKFIGKAMYWGVRIGGQVGLPTTWHWGYGWTLERGYSPLNHDENLQVQNLLANLPGNLDDLAVESAPIIRARQTLTGDNCLDLAVDQIQTYLGHGFQILNIEESIQEGASGIEKTIIITTDDCAEPFQIRFNILKRGACSTPMNELLARGRIRLKGITAPAKASCGHGVGTSSRQ